MILRSVFGVIGTMNKPAFAPIMMTLEKEFTHEESGATVWVKRSSHRVPQYEIGLGFLVGGEPQRGHRPVCTTHLGKVTMPRLADVIAALWQDAEDYVVGMRQYAEDLRIEQDIERGKPNHKAAPPGLKKLGKMDAQGLRVSDRTPSENRDPKLPLEVTGVKTIS